MGTKHRLSSISSSTAHFIRTTFLDYFKGNGHQYVHSSGVIPRKGDGTYFVNAGMNQFKSIFLGNVEPDSDMHQLRRVTNCQKCIRVGGKHNDLEAVGRDSYHHTFFEMLGSWSFGDYWKAEACKMAWELLTKVFHISEKQLYVTYFCDPHNSLNVETDVEVKEIWHQLGVPNNRILPGVMKDNFWDMGDTGPCGPCTEIHFDYLGRENASHLVNTGDPSVVELWNLVFMQYDRQNDGELMTLSKQHVDTGMGLERLVAVLQGKDSNYNTDLFTPLFYVIKHGACTPIPEYQGKFGSNDPTGVDSAYRIIADHTRMMTVAIAEGLRPGRSDLDYKLREVMHRCFRQAQILRLAPHVIGQHLVPRVVEILVDAYPEIGSNVSEISEVVNSAEDKYLSLYSSGRKLLKKLTNTSNQTLSGEAILQLTSGSFGPHYPITMIESIAKEQGIELNMDDYYKLKAHSTEGKAITLEDIQYQFFPVIDVKYLKELGVPTTNDLEKYECQPVNTKVLALITDGHFVSEVHEGYVCVVLDKTNMYAESGGQVGDQGTMTGHNKHGNILLEVQDVQVKDNYVLHKCEMTQGMLQVGDHLLCNLDQERRFGCTLNHTGTHILNYALNKVLGAVSQRGSNVTAEKLTFDFSCSKDSLDIEDISMIEKIANQMISDNLTVYRDTCSFDQARTVEGLRLLNGEEYSSKVSIVSIGTPVENLLQNPSLGMESSVELCVGTHTKTTGDLQHLLVTNLSGGAQGTKRITAVTGQYAISVLAAGRKVKKDFEYLENLVRNKEKQNMWEMMAKKINQDLLDHGRLPRVVREEVAMSLQKLMATQAKRHLHLTKKEKLDKVLNDVLLSRRSQDKYIVVEYDFASVAPKRDIMDSITRIGFMKPVMVLRPPGKRSSKLKGTSKPLGPDPDNIVEGLAYVPVKFHSQLNVAEWVEDVCQTVEGTCWAPPKGKHAKPPLQFYHLEFQMDPGQDHMSRAIKHSCQYLEEHIKNWDPS